MIDETTRILQTYRTLPVAVIEHIERLRDRIQSDEEVVATQAIEIKRLRAAIENTKGMLRMRTHPFYDEILGYHDGRDDNAEEIKRLRTELAEMTERWQTEQQARLEQANLVETYRAVKAKAEIERLRERYDTLKQQIGCRGTLIEQAEEIERQQILLDITLHPEKAMGI